VNVRLSTVWAEGGKGGEELAREVVRLCNEEKGDFRFSYELDRSIKEKIETVVRRVYGGSDVNVTPAAEKQIKQLESLGFGGLPVCIAKTQYSFSDDPAKLGAPENFTVTVKNVKVSAGAGFIVVLTGDILTMPGLPKSPAAERIDVDDDGTIHGLF
jgi:formate--tetrahydrofolate ligase